MKDDSSNRWRGIHFQVFDIYILAFEVANSSLVYGAIYVFSQQHGPAVVQVRIVVIIIPKEILWSQVLLDVREPSSL